jgi:NAD(P)-dependent dehydrogenase (short-subunit alcohol dehydrogenase family)
MDVVAGIEGNIDVLINNAGISHIGNLESTEETDLDRLYAVNVKGVYNCSRAVIGRMKESGWWRDHQHGFCGCYHGHSRSICLCHDQREPCSI